MTFRRPKKKQDFDGQLPKVEWPSKQSTWYMNTYCQVHSETKKMFV